VGGETTVSGPGNAQGVGGGGRGGKAVGLAGMVGALLLAGMLGVLTACARPGTEGQRGGTAATTPLHGPLPTYTSAPTPVAITDLGQFRRRVSAAMTSGTWAQVAPLLGPAFSFQGLDSGSGELEMPGSAQNFQKLYGAAGHWVQSSRPVDILSCDTGSTPRSQQMGFAGGDGSYLLVGLTRWQGYWVLGWAFQDPIGEAGGCA
jgi:hypothetical protein